MGQKAGFSTPVGSCYIGIRPMLHSTSKHAHMEMPEYVSHTNGNLLWDLSKGQGLWTSLENKRQDGQAISEVLAGWLRYTNEPVHSDLYPEQLVLTSDSEASLGVDRKDHPTPHRSHPQTPPHSQDHLSSTPPNLPRVPRPLSPDCQTLRRYR